MRNTHRTSRLALLALASCLLATGWTTAAWAQGSADFSHYVALGDSIGAGFMSGGLVDEVQAVSYPALIYGQMNGTTAGFEQPTVSPPGLPALFQLVNVAPVTIVPAAGLGQPTNLFLQRPYDNLCIPGADMVDILNTVSSPSNPYYDLVLRGLGTELEQAIGGQATFVTLWVSGDAITAATSGVVIDDVTLTSSDAFGAQLGAIAGALASFGIQMAIGTVPDVTAVPFVTTIPPILINPATNEPVLVNGQPVPLIGPDGPLVLGQDFVLLTAQTELAQGRGIPVAFGGSGQPLSTFAVLSHDEVAVISQRIDEFNAAIRAVANGTGAAVVDINGRFNEVAANGFQVGGIDYTADFITGGIFGLDGFHPSPMGQAILANTFIEAINDTYGSDIPPVDYTSFMFGPAGSAGTGFPVGFDFRFSKKAAAQLWATQDLPSKRELKRMLRRIAHGKPPTP